MHGEILVWLLCGSIAIAIAIASLLPLHRVGQVAGKQNNREQKAIGWRAMIH